MGEPESELTDSLRRLSKKSGLSLFGLPAGDRDAILAACQQYCRSKPFPVNERGFTGYVQEWLDKTAAFVRTDSAELRRTLVDLDFVRRDPAGASYTLGPLGVGLGVDLTELIVTSRAEEREARERRKSERTGS
ncbi:MAG TPA: hypothetical protein VGG68_01175 [Caulobacteraceae bacterium]|jgi:hypothetical protein